MQRIVIVGGGVIGSSIAYHLAALGHADAVTVVEPDPTYEFAATPRSIGGVRLQQGLPENVQMSLYGLEVYTNFDKHVRTGVTAYDPAFHAQGYLFMVPDRESAKALERTVAMQGSLGVDVALLDRDELRRRYPSFTFENVEAASFSAADGQIDPNAALMGYRRGAEVLGVAYLEDRVTAIEANGRRVTAARTAKGRTIAADLVINAANCWAPEICAMIGLKVPIEPLQRQQFYFLSQDRIEAIPVMRELSGFVVRPERKGYLVAITKFNQAGGFNWTLEHDLFDEFLWPELARRSTAFEAIKVQSGWVGHYDMNRFDNNPIIGPCEGYPDNFILAAGFSGHGLQHAPAIGRGIGELICGGGYTTIDLSPFSYRRILENRPLADHGPKA